MAKLCRHVQEGMSLSGRSKHRDLDARVFLVSEEQQGISVGGRSADERK